MNKIWFDNIEWYRLSLRVSSITQSQHGFAAFFQRTKHVYGVWCSLFHCGTFSSPLNAWSGIHLGYMLIKTRTDWRDYFIYELLAKGFFAYIHFSLRYLRLLYLTSSQVCFFDNSSVWVTYLRRLCVTHYSIYFFQKKKTYSTKNEIILFQCNSVNTSFCDQNRSKAWPNFKIQFENEEYN